MEKDLHRLGALRLNMKTIAELRSEYEHGHGCRVRSYRAYPVIGRGTVVHDWISHEQADRAYLKARGISFLTRIKWLLGGRLWWT
jgi:hypothetical protein